MGAFSNIVYGQAIPILRCRLGCINYKASAPTIVYIKFFIIWLLNLPIKSPFSKYITNLQSVPIVQNPTRPKTYIMGVHHEAQGFSFKSRFEAWERRKPYHGWKNPMWLVELVLWRCGIGYLVKEEPLGPHIRLLLPESQGLPFLLFRWFFSFCLFQRG